MLAGIIGFLLAISLSDQAIHDWGWRVPFLVGVAIIPIGIAIRSWLPETAGASRHPAAETSVGGVLLRLFADHRRMLVLGMLVIMSGTIATYVGMNMPTYATATLGLSFMVLDRHDVGAWFHHACVQPRRRLGRPVRPASGDDRAAHPDRARRHPGLLWLIRRPSPETAYAVTIVISTLTAITSTGSIVAIPEALPRAVRSAGLAIVYALSVTIFGGSTQWVVNKLIAVTGDKLSPAYYLAAVSVVGTIAALLMPETKGGDLD